MPRARGSSQVEVAPDVHYNIRLLAARKRLPNRKVVEQAIREMVKREGMEWAMPPPEETDEGQEEEAA